jgi:hypothetical protein
MKLTDKYFGYPVLSPLSDDYNGQFDINISTSIDEENETIIVSLSVVLDNDDLRMLIDSNKAIFTIHMEESKTCFREIFEFNSYTSTFSIPIGKVKETIEANAFITIKDRIQFYPKTIHEFYSGIEIVYDKYQTIALSNTKMVEISKENDEIKESSSIFSIVSDKTKTLKYIKIELKDERIVIVMPEQDYILYYKLMRQNSMKNRNKEILLSNIVMPIMVEVLQILKEDAGLYEDKIWFKSLLAAYQEKNINLLDEFVKNGFSPYYFSQLIFDAVIGKSLMQVEKLTEERG